MTRTDRTDFIESNHLNGHDFDSNDNSLEEPYAAEIVQKSETLTGHSKMTPFDRRKERFDQTSDKK